MLSVSGGITSTADVADWTDPIAVVKGSDPTVDFPDWSKASVVVAGSITPVGPPVASQSAWWDASQITGVSDGALLASWPDSGGTGHTLSQGTAANQPTYYSTTAGNLVNGLPAVWFAGNQYLTLSGLTVPQPWTVFYVANNTDTTLGHSPLIFESATPNLSFGIQHAGTNVNLELNAGNSLLLLVSSGAGLHCNFLTANGASSLVQQDGASTTGNAGTAGMGPGNTFQMSRINSGGSSVGWSGPICEMAVYPRALTTVERSTLRGYAQGKWGTP